MVNVRPEFIFKATPVLRTRFIQKNSLASMILLKKILNKGSLYLLLKHRSKLTFAIKFAISNTFSYNLSTLLNVKYTHVAVFSSRNAGDTLLPVVLRDLFSSCIEPIVWKAIDIHSRVTNSILNEINSRKVVVIGGGGLFISDSNPNSISGWQWAISEDQIKAIRAKLIIFAVGYNQFRGQDAYHSPSKFHDSVIQLCNKAIFIGLRNNGSIRAIKNIIPSSLHYKIKYQPCMTTLVKSLYPHLFIEESPTHRQYIAFNFAFDRPEHRFNGKQNQIVNSLLRIVSELSCAHKVCYVAHTKQDLLFLNKVDRATNITVFNLFDSSPFEIIEAYKRFKLVVGMRSHSQLIPFGCEIPIISIVTHDKMQWFLDDIGLPKLGIDVNSPDWNRSLQDMIKSILDNETQYIEEIASAQKVLYQITLNNIESIKQNI